MRWIVYLPLFGIGKRVAMSWTVWRQVAEFYALHSKLSLTCPRLKSSQLPAVSGKSLFGKLNDRAYLERAQDKLQSFLDVSPLPHLKGCIFSFPFLNGAME